MSSARRALAERGGGPARAGWLRRRSTVRSSATATCVTGGRTADGAGGAISKDARAAAIGRVPSRCERQHSGASNAGAPSSSPSAACASAQQASVRTAFIGAQWK